MVDEFRELQSQIKESGLQDYTDWVQTQGEVLSAENDRGDTKKIHEVVNALKGKPDKPPANLTQCEPNTNNVKRMYL